jgi:hypothetical protein
MPKKKSRRPRSLKPGEALYAAESIKPGVSKVEASRRAGLDCVPQGAHVRRFREKLIDEQKEEAGISAARTLREIGLIAYSRPNRMHDPQTGELLQLHEMDEETLASVSVEYIRRQGENGEEIVCKISSASMSDKRAALDLLTKIDLEAQRRGAGGPLQQPPVFHVHFVKPQLKDGDSNSTIQ